MGVVSTAGQPPNRPGRVGFSWLVANFYSLKAKKISSGGAALGDWLGQLGHYRVSTELCLIQGQEACW